MAYIKTASKGCQWVLTEKGYSATPEHVRHEREVGKPVFPMLGYAESVPVLWVNNGWVEERAVNN